MAHSRLISKLVLLFIGLWSNSLVAQTQQDSIVISGRLAGLGNRSVTVSISNGASSNVYVKAVATNDSFSMRFPVQQEPAIVKLTTAAAPDLSHTTPDGKRVGMPIPGLQFFIYRSALHIQGAAEWPNLAMVTGDEENNGLSQYKLKVQKEEQKNWALRKQLFFISDTSKARKFVQESMETHKTITTAQKQFVAEHPDALASLYLLGQMANLYTQQQYEEAFQALSGKYKNTAISKSISDHIARLQPTAAGRPAIAFTKKDKDGKTINLSDYKGKLVLLDFWGSWCGPCRASHPHLKELYATYQPKGFEIIAIAQEVNKDPAKQRQLWLEAIEKDGLPWIHILNNETATQQNLVKEYAITGFPTKILLDTDGKILLRVTASATNDIDIMLEEKLGTKK